MIKQEPSGFLVEEELSPAYLATAGADYAAKTPFALCSLTKESLDTPAAVSLAAKALGIHHNFVSFAGLKDKHARTIQHITFEIKPDANPKTQAGAYFNQHGQGWRVQFVGWTPRAITSSDIERNRFTIDIHNLTSAASQDMAEAAKLLSGPSGPVVVNYFGDQRFGSARHHQGFVAKHLIQGDFEGALKLAIATEARKDRMDRKRFKRAVLAGWGRWRELLTKTGKNPHRRAIERLAANSGDFIGAFMALPYLEQQFCIYAYQSHLWNTSARKLIESSCAGDGKILAADSLYGQMLFPIASAIPESVAGIELPLLARNTELKAPWDAAVKETLAEEGIELDQLQVKGMRRPFFGEEPRALFITAQNFKLGREEKEPGGVTGKNARYWRTVSFSLPRGCYATVVLRALGQ